MQTQDIFIIEPSTLEETKALRAFIKALRLKFNISKAKISDSKKDLLNNIQQGLKEVKLIEEGKLKPTSAKDFLDEL